MTLTVACVLRSGGPYTPAYVQRIRRRVCEHLTAPHNFVCLTDLPVNGVDTVPLAHKWPGYWSKIELFRPGLFTGRVLYFDLDTDIVGSLDDLARFDGRFAMVHDWTEDIGASPVMAWDADRLNVADVYEPFARNPTGAMASARGDQDWISNSLPWKSLRGLYPGQIVSRWLECVEEVPEGARVVCWHGTPRPHEIDWAPTGSVEHWKAEVAA